MTSVFKNQQLINKKEPATHAIIIGVGEYPDASKCGLDYLSSPPVSATAFVEWLKTEYHNPNKPLASIELLISEKDKKLNIDCPDLVNTKQAIFDWIQLGDINPNNLMIFYFCGHGLSTRKHTTLLLNSFGEKKQIKRHVLVDALDFTNFYLGMDSCRAREQCFFIDVCRSHSDIVTSSLDFFGDRIIEGYDPPNPKRRHYAIYYSTLYGDFSHGRPGVPSVFTDSLIKSLDGGAGVLDPTTESWIVDSDSLNRAIGQIMKKILKGKIRQVIKSDTIQFHLHYFKSPPKIPIIVTCNPEMANEDADLSYENIINGDRKVRGQKDVSPWKENIQVGEIYDFSASFEKEINFETNHIKKYLYPLSSKVEINVLKEG